MRREPRTVVNWGTKELPSERADSSFYRLCGVTGSGKSHLTKLFILDILRELETNPHAKLVVYEPKREFFAWLTYIKKRLNLNADIRYFMPSDTRSVALDFTKDYRSEQDTKTLAHAFYPLDNKEQTRFWGDSLRTIYAAVYDSIRQRLGYADLRLMCLVLENERYTNLILQQDPYHAPARNLAMPQGGSGVTDTAKNIMMTVYSRIAEMKVLAAHLDACWKKNGELFSLRDFVRNENQGIFVVSKDSDYHLVQDPMNGVLFFRLMQLLDKEQQDPRRKVYVIIDEFPTLAGDNPCPGIKDMFLRLRSRGVCLLITYQGYTTLKTIYGEDTKGIIGQCSSFVYLRQPDPESADYASQDLGFERGREQVTSHSMGEQFSTTRAKEWFDRPKYSATELLNLPTASPARGVSGYGKSAEHTSTEAWPISYHPDLIRENLPKPPDTFRNEFPEYDEWPEHTQRLRPLSDAEKFDLFPEIYLKK